MTYRQPASEGSDSIPPPKAVPGRAQPIVTVMSADQQMRVAAAKAAATAYSGNDRSGSDVDYYVSRLSKRLYEFIKGGT